MAKTAFLFPGQGSQYRGMFKTHWARYPAVRHTFEEASDALGFDLFALCAESAEEELARPENAQPALLAAGVAAFRVWTEKTGVVPFALAGHSLGEYTALVCSGAIPYVDALAIVRQRGWLMREAASLGKGGMLAASGLSAAEAETIVRELPEYGGRLAVACFNGSRQQVFSGTEAALLATDRLLAARGTKTIPLKVGAAFHSPLMAEAASKLEAYLRERSASFRTPRSPVVANTTAKPYGEGAEAIVALLVRQMTEPVRWMQTMAYLREQDVDCAIDFGPGRTLKNLLLQDNPAVVAYAFDFTEDHDKLILRQWREGRRSRSNRRVLEACLAAAAATRNRSADEQAYVDGAVKPYRAIEQVLLDCEKRGTEPTDEEAQDGLRRLAAILQAKGASERERQERMNEIMDRIHRKEGAL